MESLFHVHNLDAKDKHSIFTYKSREGKEKSFLIFLHENEEYFFKPLSYSKPYCTPLFAFSEVFWSFMIRKYFDQRTPVSKLAICPGMEKIASKYRDQGTLVKSINQEGCRIVSLLELLQSFDDISPEIKRYTNYCMVYYNYVSILQSKFFQEHRELGEKLAFQILVSILREDQNFHYENVGFYEKDGEIIDICPPLDFEYSSYFLNPEEEKTIDKGMPNYCRRLLSFPTRTNQQEQEKGKKKLLSLGYTEDILPPKYPWILQNVALIVELYPEMVEKFIETLEQIKNEFSPQILEDPDNYIIPCSSSIWHLYQSLYSEEEKEEMRQKIHNVPINKEKVFDFISKNILLMIDHMKMILEIYLHFRRKGKKDLVEINIEEVVAEFGNQYSYFVKLIKQKED